MNKLRFLLGVLESGERVAEPPGAEAGVSLVRQEPLPGPSPVSGLQPPLAPPHGLGRDQGHGLVWLELSEINGKKAYIEKL